MIQQTKLSLVIPAFNEAENITDSLNEIETYMKSYMGQGEWEAIVVNDGSTDNTVSVLNNIRLLKNWLKVIDLGCHRGRGRALREGLKASSGNIIISLDADLSYAPYHIERLVEKLKKEGADIVLASAYMKGGTVKNVPFRRLFLSRLGNNILSYMFGRDITVFTCLVRAYKRDIIKQLDLHSNDKEIHLEILHKAVLIGAKIVEVPADLHWRETKLLKSASGKQNKRRSTLKIKKTSSSHLFFALLNKPGFVFWIPGYFLVAISFFIFFIIAATVSIDIAGGTPVYFAIRNSMLKAAPSWLTMATSFILGIQFFTLGFLTNQSKRNYEETYKTLNAIYSKLNEIKD